MTTAPASFEVGGVRIHVVGLNDVVPIIEGWIVNGRRDYVVLTGAHGVVEMQRDLNLREINNAAGLTTPDGMPLVWLGRRAGFRSIEKVYAPDIMDRAFAHGVDVGWKSFLYGGKEGVAQRLEEVLRSRYPGAQIVGTFSPPFRPLSPREEVELAAHINSSGANIVWVGLGCPKQEIWMARFRPLLSASVLIGVGAGFDFVTGGVRQAPRWIQQSGFEWLYRLLVEPRRLWPRYSRVIPRFLKLAIPELIWGPRVVQPRNLESPL
jgi:N-acetylglucosaminyldiphosphoundecaprenol N-acetyl-beta-D-mannosaminyltransferase